MKLKHLFSFILLIGLGIDSLGQDGDPGDYIFECTFVAGDFINQIYFNDPDGDCKTTDWYLIITDSEGNVFIRNSEDFEPPLTWDLGHHGCCPYADSGGGSSGGGTGGDSGGGSGGSSECWFNSSNCTDCPDNLWGDCVFECQGC